MKAFISSAIVAATLAACGGGGGGSTGTPAPACTYATVSEPTPIQINGNSGVQTISDTSKKLSIIVTGNQNTITLGQCVYVESLTFSGEMNTLSGHSTSRIQAVRYEINSAMNTVTTNAASNTTVTDFGNLNVVNRN